MIGNIEQQKTSYKVGNTRNDRGEEKDYKVVPKDETPEEHGGKWEITNVNNDDINFSITLKYFAGIFQFSTGLKPIFNTVVISTTKNEKGKAVRWDFNGHEFFYESFIDFIKQLPSDPNEFCYENIKNLL